MKPEKPKRIRTTKEGFSIAFYLPTSALQYIEPEGNARTKKASVEIRKTSNYFLSMYANNVPHRQSCH